MFGKQKIKTLSVDNKTMAEMGFFTRLKKESEMVFQFWSMQEMNAKKEFLKRQSFDPTKFIPDFTKLFEGQKVMLVPKPPEPDKVDINNQPKEDEKQK